MIVFVKRKRHVREGITSTLETVYLRRGDWAVECISHASDRIRRDMEEYTNATLLWSNALNESLAAGTPP